MPDHRRGKRLRPGWAAALVLLAVALAAAALSPRLAGQNPVTRQAVTSASRAGGEPPGDLRCLTRRAADCLAEPVPIDEPHGAVCSTCHSLWERGDSIGRIRSCTEADCHPQAATLTKFHESVSRETLADCTSCHAAHTFRVEARGADCTACHSGGGKAAEQAHTVPARRLPRDLSFEHQEHTTLECTACHAAPDRHGNVNVGRLADCRSCHHVPPTGDDCMRCHTRAEVDAQTFTVTRALEIRIGSLDRPSRTLLFEHAKHADADCRTCHTGPDLEAPASTDCSSCHLEHHEPTADCSACHAAPAPGAHDRQSHLGCGGAGCHDPVPAAIEWAPRTRDLCLACHTDRTDHRRGKTCADCHVLPAPGGPAKPATGR